MCRGKEALDAAKNKPRGKRERKTPKLKECGCGWLEATVLDDVGTPLPNEQVALFIDSDSSTKKIGKTDADGVVRFEDLPGCSHYFVLQLPDILEAWRPPPLNLPPSWIPKPDSYRANDGTIHPVSPCTPAGSQRVLVNQLSEAEKLLYFERAYEDNEARWGGAKPRAFAKTGAPRWTWGKGAVCHQHVNFFLSYWFNYNADFTPEPGHLWMELLRTSAVHDGHRGFQEFLDACDGDYVYNVADGKPLQYMHIGATRADRASGLPSRVFFEALADYNVYSLADPTVDGGYRARSAKYARDWLHKHPDRLPPGKTADGIADEEALNLLWDVREDDKEATQLLKDLRLHGINVDHHGGVLFKKGDDLCTFSADGYEGDRKKIVEKRWATSDLKRYFLHLAIFRLKPLRPGGFAPIAAEGNEGEISVHNPPRFIEWTR